MTRFAILVLFLTACGKHPSHELAQAACEHQIELGFWKGFEDSVAKAGHDPKDPELHKMGEASLVDQKKGADWKKALDDCTSGLESGGTTEQLECVKAATSTDGAMACLK